MTTAMATTVRRSASRPVRSVLAAMAVGAVCAAAVSCGAPADGEPTATSTPTTPAVAADERAVTTSAAANDAMPSNVDIYRLDLDGGEPVRLTDDARVEGSPAWSPDGSRIAFARVVSGDGETGNAEIFVMGADGSDPRQLTFDDRRDWHPSWSPDGSQLTFDRVDGDHGEIYVIDADGSNERVLVETGDVAFGPSWSPDGSSIAYVSGGGIWTTSIDGASRQQVTEGPGDTMPSWSVDGRTIVFQARPSREGTGAQLATVAAGGAVPVEVPSPRALGWPAAGSVDDELLAVDLVEAELYLIGSDGSDRRRLTTDQFGDALGAQPWGPTRRQLVYESARRQG